MTLEQLRIFVAVAERQHVTAAARALNLAQSAVSHAVAVLEAEFGARLFDRVGRRIELTGTGRLFLDEARAVLNRAEAARLLMADLGALRRGVLPIHASQTIAGYWLPARLVAFHARYPSIDIRLSIGNTAQVARAVRDGDAALGFVEGAIEDESLTSRVVARDQLVLVVPPGHPWSETPPRTASDLAAGTWVLREAGSGTRSEFASFLLGMGLAPEALDIGLELPSNEAVRAAAEAGAGAAVLSASVVAASLEAGLLRQVPFALPERRFLMIRHRARDPGRSAASFAAMLDPAGTEAG
ncbi:LysR substrate-binding domain-containing protein [Nguyenibacter vanlangensis]|uniref:LysR substrate-binding domain-containing protein n=1 Tax=Nguyenibacter vanlangensis TaxID=1216886 RepID=A0ABZ3D991_9PROT